MSTYQPKTGVIFDLDGTLLDTLADLTDSVNQTLMHFGYKARSLDEIKSFVGSGIKKIIKKALPVELKSEDFACCLSYFLKHYSKNLKNKTKPYSGVLRMLKQLKEDAIPLAIVSNKYQEGVETLRNSFFADTVHIAIGNQDGMMPKPAPDSLYLAICKLGLDANKDRIFFVGDSEIDILTSRNANIPIIAVTWGFRTEEQLAALNPAYLVNKPEEVIKIIKKM